MNRTSLQGVVTIVRFNWHLYAVAIAGILALLWVATQVPAPFPTVLRTLAFLVALSLLVSLAASYLAYDASGLYRFAWLDSHLENARDVANIHAGFDESSVAVEERFPQVNLQIYDFYDPGRHTEVSIRRARKAHPPDPRTVAISTDAVPVPDASFDVVLLILAAHEIRDSRERTRFLAEIGRALKENGRIVLVEHLRDLPNLAAYNIGAFHFHSRREWLRNIAAAGLRVVEERELNRFISCLVLGKG